MEDNFDITDFSIEAQVSFIKQENELLTGMITTMEPSVEKQLWEYRAKMFSEIEQTLKASNLI
jgi:hypothetical protein